MSLPFFGSKKISHPLEDDYDEEIRVAEEMSFLDEYDLSFDPLRLEDTKDRVKMYEDIVDEQLLIIDNKFEEEGAPLRVSQVQDLFFGSLDSDKFGSDDNLPKVAAADYSPTVFLEKRSFSREQRLKETVDSIRRSLRWYQSKIVKQIQATSDDGNLAPLIELNDQVSSVLTKTDRIVQNERETLEMSTRKRSSTKQSQSSSKHESSSFKEDSSPHQTDSQAVLNAVYALRRVTDREETLIAVENLIRICELEGEVRTSAVRQMINAGALQLLLMVLSRAAEWPEVESQITKVVSVLVTYEDDWTILQRSALIILTSLYTLQLKTQSRARSRSGAWYRSSNNSSGPPFAEMAEAMSSLSLSDLPLNNSDRLSITTGSSLFDTEQQQQSQDVRALVAAAVAKFSLVLANEWCKQESPFGEFPIPAGPSNMSVTNSFQHGLDRVEKMRSILTRHSKTIRPALNEGGNVDSNRILQVLLSLILAISEASLSIALETNEIEEGPTSLSQLRTPIKFGSSSLSLLIPPTQSDQRDLLIQTNNLTQGDYSYQRIDQFLFHSFGISFENLLSGSVSTDSLQPRLVDSSAVLCSTALMNIAEVPHCRPGLVAGGALRMIKSWLEIGVHMLKFGQMICTEFISQITNMSAFQDSFMRLYGPVYELIGNATAALMFLAGGSTDSKSPAAYFPPSNPLSSGGGGGRDYIIGWIDAQILAEGLPDVLVNLVLASHQSFLQSGTPQASSTSAPNNTAASANIPSSPRYRHLLSPCLLPGPISKNIAQFLFQICSRPQNRSRLQGSSIPYVLCTIFEKSVAAVKYTIDHTLGLDSARPTADDDEGEVEEGAITTFEGGARELGPSQGTNSPLMSHSGSSSAVNLAYGVNSNIQSLSPITNEGHSPKVVFKVQVMNDFYRKIFEFGMMQSLSLLAEIANDPHQYSNQHYHQRQKLLQEQQLQQQQQKKLAEQQQHHGSSRFFSSFAFSHRSTHHSHHNHQTGNSATQNHGHGRHEANPDGVNHHHQRHHHSNHHLDKVPPELIEMMSLITAACLDTIGNYFADEMNQAQFRATPAASANAAVLKSSASNATLLKENLNGGANFNLPLFSLMCNHRIMAAILMVTSNLPKGPGRLSAIRIISSLTAWPEAMVALYDASIMDALLLISSETEEFGNSTIQPSHPNNPNNLSGYRTSEGQRESHKNNHDGVSVQSFPTKPGAIERASSNNSTISGLSSCNSLSRRSHSFHRNHQGKGENGLGAATPITSLSHLDDFMDDEEQLHLDMALEETLYVCFSLANLCHSNPAYALRMFSSGLLTIMSRLAKSSHLDIAHQALRCMHAMCSAVAAKLTSPEESQSISPRNNHRAVLRETLEVLTEAMRSESPYVQKEALLSIAQLCLVGEEFRDRVMSGCMRSITSISVNPNYARELRSASEEVVRNCGFYSGLKDFEICGYDYEILKEWYFLKRSLKPQEIGRKLLDLWVERLFTDQEPLYGRQSLLFSASSMPSGAATVVVTDSEGNAINELYQFSLAGEIGDLLHVSSFSWVKHDSSSLIATTQQTLSGLPHLHRQLTDSFFRLLPICFPKFADSSSHHNHQNHFGSGDDLDVPYARGSSMSSHHSRDNGAIAGSAGGPGGFLMNRSAYSPAGGGGSSHHHQLLDNYTWIDRPPLIVTNMYDMFYSSRMHQLLVMDITSIGVCIPVTTPDRESGTFSQGEISEIPLEEEEEEEDEQRRRFGEELAFLIPHPHSIYCILLPSRTYQSFTRVGRVLQRMFETADPSQLWALSFRDCEYQGDFHTSLLQTLQRCPQICSISFSSSNRVEDDALLGHLVGQIPSSVRFISFRSTLSHESIQALCILLRTHNAAFLNSSDFEELDRMVLTPTSSKHSSYRSAPASSMDSGTGPQFLKNYASPTPLHEDSKNTSEKGPAAETAYPPPSNKGLLGLALTHLTLEAPEIQQIVELLQPSKHTPLHKTPRGKGTFATSSFGSPPLMPLKRGESQTSTLSSSTPKSAGSGGKIPANATATATPFIGSAASGKLGAENLSLRGLKYLDLGYNSLSDVDCATIFKAAISGPLEGLELGGNMLLKASKFVEALTAISSPKQIHANPNRLRYLGLSNNTLSNKAFTGILYKLVENTSLTGLDLSNNNIESTATNNESLRSFIKKNKSLRLLDLSHNKLTTESYRLMHLGLLENQLLLMLPLYGNQNVETSPSVELIQVKLRENRLVYKAQSKDFSYGFTKRETDYYPTEDISSRISFGGIIEVPPIIATTSTPSSASSSGNINDHDNSMATATTIAILEGEDELQDPASLLPSQVKPPAVHLDAILAAEETKDNKNTAVASHDGGKKLSIVAPAELKREDSEGKKAGGGGLPPHPPTIQSSINSTVAIAIPVPSPRVTSVSTSTNIPSIPNTPKRQSGKFFVASDLSSSSALSISSNPLSGGGASVSSLATMSQQTSTMDLLEDSAHGTMKEQSKGNTQVFASFANTLNVLFSAPLAGFDRTGRAHPLEVLDYTSERDTLIQVFKEVHRDIAVHFDFATTDSLRTILSFGCKTLHFSGHGMPKGLCFEDGKSGLQVIREAQLKDLLSAGGLSLEFVFVSACYSKEIGEAFVKAGVAHVVCVKVDSKIPDSAAIAFTRAFYVAFLSGKTVKASFAIAKEALKLSPYVPDSVFEGDKFILLPELTSTESKHHDKSLFANRLSIDWPNPGQCTIGANRTDLKHILARIRIPSPPADFEGREVIMNSIIRHILDRRLVSLTGEDGVGKSAVAAAVCKYMADREFFSDAIVYLKCKGYKDFPSFLHGLQHALLHSGHNTVTKKMQELIALHHHHPSSSHNSTNTGTGATTAAVSIGIGVSVSSAILASSSSSSTSNAAIEEEELIFTCLESMKILLVLDHLDDLVSDFGESVTYFRLFLNRLFEQCPQVKVLNVSTDTLSMFNIYVGAGIVEYSVSLGPLTLNSTLRLFARLAPSLTTIHDKLAFIDSLQPARQHHVTIHSREISNAALQILAMFGEGHPAKIVHMACESSAESVEELKRLGKKIIQQSTVNLADLVPPNHNIIIADTTNTNNNGSINHNSGSNTKL